MQDPYQEGEHAYYSRSISGVVYGDFNYNGLFRSQNDLLKDFTSNPYYILY